MNWIDFPPLAEFADRHGIVRAIRGTTIFGKFEFADRMTDITTILDESATDVSWEQVYIDDARFRHGVIKALDCWGIDVEWLVPAQIEQLLFRRGDDVGWLIELSQPKTAQPESSGKATIEEALAAISTHCQSLSEALELANNTPADLLVEVLKQKTNQIAETEKKSPKQDFIKQNYDDLMARF